MKFVRFPLKALLPLLVLLLAQSCALMGGKGDKDVKLVDALTPDQTSSHTDMGVITFSESSEHRGDEKDAIAQFGFLAERMGADLVLVQERDRVPCEMNHEWKCLVIKGHAFRENPAPGAHPAPTLNQDQK